MGLEVISGYVVAILLIIVVVGFALKSAKKGSLIIINILFGGAFFLILNILGLDLPVNALTIGLTIFLGFPGVVLILFFRLFAGL